RGRRAVDRGDVVRVLQVDAEDRGDDLHLVAEVVREGRAQRTVGETGGEYRVLARAPLAPEERAGDLPGRIHPFLYIDGQREEVDALSRLGRRDSREHGGAPHLG